MFISKKKLKKKLSDEFYHGIEVGKDLGGYDTYVEAKEAYETGNMEWWLEKQRPKTSEEWEAWEAENGPLSS